MSKDRYTRIRQVGSGGMAEVWKARMQGAAGFQKTVAIKQVLPGMAKDPQFVKRFISEAKVVAELVHPNIVQVHDFGELEEGVYFIAMEYIAGCDLQTLSARMFEDGQRFPPEIVLYVGIETAKALGYASSRQPPVIHRDISPHNLLVSFEGEVKVADFGIAKVAGSSTVAGTVKGKLGYLSPEQANGLKVDRRSDLFSLGVTMFKLLTKRDLFPGNTVSERYAAVARFDAKQLKGLLATVPRNLRGILDKLLRPDPDERYGDAFEVEADLSRALDLDSIVPTRRALAQLVQKYCPEEFKLEAAEGSGSLEEIAKTHSLVAASLPDVAGAAEPSGSPAPPKPSPPLSQPRSTRSPSPVRRRVIGIAAFVVLTALFTTTGLLAQRYFLRTTGRAIPSPDPSEVTTELALASPTEALEDSPSEPTDTASIVTQTVEETPVATTEATATPRRRPTRVVNTTPKPTPKPTATPKIVRKVPKHAVSLLDGCSEKDLELVETQIRAAIRLGAPAYNRGDIDTCFRIYTDVAKGIEKELPQTCPGPTRALEAGLKRAGSFDTARQKAWAMRDAFDGLLNVIRRKNRS